MMSDLIKEHARLAKHVRAMEDRLERERAAALTTLPREYGYPDLKSFIRALKDAAGDGSKKQGPRRKRKAAVIVEATPLAVHPIAVPLVSPQATPEDPEGTAAAMLPTGTSLDDPTNFGLLPDITVLERGTLNSDPYIARVGEALRFAERVLHTSKVPARVWREWRLFERKAVEAIQSARQ